MSRGKRGRRKPRRNTGPGAESQHSQKLHKRLQSLPATADLADEDAWDAVMGEATTSEPPPRPTMAAAPAEPEPQDPETEVEAHIGTVVALGSGFCLVEAEDETIECTLPSKLARDQRARIAVGDQVRFAAHGSDHRVLTTLPRRTVLSRPDPQNPRRERVIAANVDLVVHVSAFRSPPLRTALIDRFLVAIARSGATPLICVNKLDRVPPSERQDALALLAAYEDLEVEVVTCSAKTGEGIQTLRDRLAGCTAVFVGHSGVGKSSLLNALAPGLGASTGAVAQATGKGRHTTTGSSLHHLPGGARLIDTPGIRAFGLWKLSPEDLGHYFPDLQAHAAGCRFHNCAHREEPACAVRQAVATGALPAARYAAYQRIRDALAETDV